MSPATALDHCCWLLGRVAPRPGHNKGLESGARCRQLKFGACNLPTSLFQTTKSGCRLNRIEACGSQYLRQSRGICFRRVESDTPECKQRPWFRMRPLQAQTELRHSLREMKPSAWLALASWALLQAGPALALPVTGNAASLLPGGLGDSAFREGAASGFLLILFSELGDKTFFIALLLSLNKPKSAVFVGTFGALAIMTVISVGLGQILHKADQLLPSKSSVPIDDILAAALLIFFGLKTLQEAYNNGTGGERSEALEEINRLGSGATGLVLSTLALVFAAEWGDKSFLATIALAAASSPVGVVLGAIAGHGVATGIAVLGGSVLGELVSETVVQYVGGSLFLVFAAITIADIVRGVNLA